MKRMLFVWAAFVLLSAFAARGDAVAWDGETPPLVLTNVTIQIWGDAELREEIPPVGMMFLREDGEVCVGDGVTPGGRPVCHGVPDWHVFHKALEINGNEIRLNSTMGEQASGAKLTWTADGEKVFWILSADEAEGGQSPWETLAARMTNGYLMLTAHTTNENAVVLSTTNLLKATSWAVCTNAVLQTNLCTVTSMTWRITQQAQAEFYRVRKDVPVTPAGIYAELPLVALRGVTMDGVTVTNWSQITDAIAAVSSALIAHTSATNPHGITAEGIGALTNETDAVALAALVPVEARVGSLEELHEKPETCTLWWTDSTMSSGYNYLPTNYTTRNLRVIIYSTNGSRSISMPTSFVPSKATKVEVLLYLVGTPSIVMRYGTKSIQSVNVSSSSYRRYEFSWEPVVGVWTLTSHTQNTSSQSFSGGSVYDVPTNAPSEVWQWEYMLEHGVLPPSNQLSMFSSPQLVPSGGLSPAIIQPDAALDIGSLENLDGLEELDEPEESWNEDVLEEEMR